MALDCACLSPGNPRLAFTGSDSDDATTSGYSSHLDMIGDAGDEVMRVVLATHDVSLWGTMYIMEDASYSTSSPCPIGSCNLLADPPSRCMTSGTLNRASWSHDHVILASRFFYDGSGWFVPRLLTLDRSLDKANLHLYKKNLYKKKANFHGRIVLKCVFCAI